MARVTITQVAARAGVSVASASRALNGLIASAETVAKVRDAARELGYVADATAQSLKRGRTLQLGYAVADIGNPVYVEMMAAIERVVSASGYRLLLSSTGTASSSVDVVRDLGRGYVDGLILSPLRVTDELLAALAAAPIPLVVLGRLPDSAEFDTVRADSLTAMRLVVDHLVAAGRRDIAFVNGPADTTPGGMRREGFIAAAANHRDLRTQHIDASDFTIAAGYDAAFPLLDRSDRPSAVVAANDLIGVGVLRAAEDLGLSVPADLAVTGVDDTELAEVVRPGLTSVDLGAKERGRAAAEMLLARIAEPGRPAHTVTVPPSLVVRGSSSASAPSALRRPELIDEEKAHG
ncbi:LacI family DNA-binding transcriptional regulator [Microbacterium lushaniae]|uniref:LacI family transcriptional regulator n=1 Tax=Microbacterium lushaniae TaxID=2614639 RepID=A0A5J5JL44_9MICO|nr:LacI family DNA-binding transcriptional regulator [Microbacterium lushaniae]KAA9148469.1 LacI family transcriptional regulator [Microbacterium lushaniae]KAA9156488.1 LacI family transcriptional regulator [Microbacterium lushaniae]QEW02288.1 LacI family transcriptional regulator [Microbacterium lushaniae]